MYLCESKHFVMLNKQIERYIPVICDYLRTQPVRRAWIFGSCSRGEENSNSDIDILVDYDDTKQFVNLFTISKMINELGKMLKRRVDLVENDGLLPFAVESVNRDKILIYEIKS